jgi:hypothetical protein
MTFAAFQMVWDEVCGISIEELCAETKGFA